MPVFRLIFTAALLAVSAPFLLGARRLAYIDPGSGSFIIQIAIATVLGGAFMVRMWFSRIVGIFRRTPADADEPDPTQDIDPD